MGSHINALELLNTSVHTALRVQALRFLTGGFK